MLNKVMIIGRLGRDPELRYTQTGAPICSLSVATDESYQDRDGNKVERTEWHRVNVFQRAAENCANYLVKGSLVFVEGSLQTRKWTDQQGVERYTTEIKAQRVQFLDSKRNASAPHDEQSPDQGRQSKPEGKGYPATQTRHQPAQPAQSGGRPRQAQRPQEEDLGPAFSSEAGSAMDEVPF